MWNIAAIVAELGRGSSDSNRGTVAGETLSGNGFAIHEGGKGGNQAVAAARCGARVAMIGRVGDVEICTPFSGALMGMLALPGERLTSSQPVAWLDAAPATT